MSQRQHTKQREGSREVPEMMVGKQNAKPGSSVIGIEIKRGVPSPFAVHPPGPPPLGGHPRMPSVQPGHDRGL